ncbi:HipA family kinase [Pseudomonas sp. YY-1]|uniref:HipA family kinase n=1 Tax=Pseudomonas sp. YY-1 TaxID=2058659 RepID=UPI0012FF2587|nr:HipA family kinase [Pseudomonas sp. YY-1]
MTDTKPSGEASPIILPSSIAYQKRLFPIEIIASYPNNQGSADLGMIGSGRDGRDYAIKTTKDGRGHVPASEAFSYELARRLLIPTPPYEFVSLPGGEIAFGSVWEGGVRKLSDQTQILQLLQGNPKVNGIKRFFSRVYAFDIFINNVDRHFGNYIWRESFNNNLIGLAFDFSRAWFETDPYGLHALDLQQNTARSKLAISVTGNYDRNEALSCLSDIEGIDRSEIEEILSNIPNDWMSKAKKNEYKAWWRSEIWLTRIETIRGVL